jgi:hypothetical protein
LRTPEVEGLIANIAPPQLKEIESVHAHRHTSGLQQCKEVGLTMSPSGNQLAVDDAR